MPTTTRALTFFLGFVFVGIVVLTWAVNEWIAKEFSPNYQKAVYQPANGLSSPEQTNIHNQIKGVVRKMRLEPNRKFYESIFFAEGQEIARYKSEGEVFETIYDLQGTIPDGKVDFVNESRGTYGQERYKDGKRHGMYEEFYREGGKRKEIVYYQGNVNEIREYFIDGQVRMRVDYYDAVEVPGEKEVGRGKIYFRDGSLMYEWNLTNTDENRYKKSYNIKGDLVEVKTYDRQGQLIQKKRLGQELTVPNQVGL